MTLSHHLIINTNFELKWKSIAGRWMWTYLWCLWILNGEKGSDETAHQQPSRSQLDIKKWTELTFAVPGSFSFQIITGKKGFSQNLWWDRSVTIKGSAYLRLWLEVSNSSFSFEIKKIFGLLLTWKVYYWDLRKFKRSQNKPID